MGCINYLRYQIGLYTYNPNWVVYLWYKLLTVSSITIRVIIKKGCFQIRIRLGHNYLYLKYQWSRSHYAEVILVKLVKLGYHSLVKKYLLHLLIVTLSGAVYENKKTLRIY